MINIEEHLGLAYKSAIKFSKRMEYDDAFQLACEGLVVARNRFDESKGFAFSTYAMSYINGYLCRYLRDKNHVMKPTRPLLDLNKEVVELHDDKEMTFEQIAKKLKKPYDKVVQSYYIYEPLASLDFNVVGKDNSSVPFHETISDGFDLEEDVINKSILKDGIEVLTDKEKDVIYYRYFLDLTQDESAKRLGYSQAQTSRIEKKALKKLRESLT